MTVTLTVQQLANDMRVSPLDTETEAMLTRELEAAKVIVERRAPNAPTSIQNIATIQLCSFWFDSGRMSNSWKFSGAYDTLRPYIRVTPVAVVSETSE